MPIGNPAANGDYNMIVWRIVGNEIGYKGSGAAYFTKKRDAVKALKSYRKANSGNGGDPNPGSEPKRIKVKGRKNLVKELNDAVVHGTN